jgi:SAM-dependent methyltransferase
VKSGAIGAIGVELSKRMLELAEKEDHDKITFRNCAIEDFESDAETFDLVTSSLAFHYIRDLDKVILNISKWLKSRSYLVFSMEHPICTAAQGIYPGWKMNEKGEREYWILDHYHDESIRRSHWFIDGVIKYHRTTASIVNMIIESGLVIEKMLEPHAIETAEQERPTLLDERRRPPFLLIKARKP